jgi:cobalt-precorrin-5B (C1)-methyltransferase
VQAIDVAHERGLDCVVLTTGGKSEAYAMALHPDLLEEAFVQVGDFIGVGIRHAARRGMRRAIVVGMIGKLSKMAEGKTMTHAAGSEVNVEALSRLAAELGATPAVAAEIRNANTARHVLEIAERVGLYGLPALICRRVVEQLERHAEPVRAIAVEAILVHFDGRVLGRAPAISPAEKP